MTYKIYMALQVYLLDLSIPDRYLKKKFDVLKIICILQIHYATKLMKKIHNYKNI